MGRGPRFPGASAPLFFWLFIACSIGRADPAPIGRLLPLRLSNGRCECTVPTGRSTEKYVLIVGSLARDAGPYQVTIRTEATDQDIAIPLHDTETVNPRPQSGPSPRPESSKSPLEAVYPPALQPPRQRYFSVFLNEDAFQEAAGYATVMGELKAVGRHCQVYLDHDDAQLVTTHAAIDDIVRTFDQDIYPQARQRLGRVLDVDRDGRFTILLTHRLGQMARGRVSLAGFIRGADFYRDIAAPLSNRSDMMYLNSDLFAGPHLRTIVAHEYTHAIIFSEHVFAGHQSRLPPSDEECWLNEGLAHLAEDSFGYSWSNLDYRVSAFLSGPERYRLVVPDYHAAGLWRSHGNRGAAYTFLRWCADCYGSDVAARLIQSGTPGVPNLETAINAPFPELFRRWTAALALSGGGVSTEPDKLIRHIDLWGPLGNRLLCGPYIHEVGLADQKLEFDLVGTAAAYFLLHSPKSDRSRLIITAAAAADLQISLIRLPKRTARVSMRAQSGRGAECRLSVTAYDVDVTLNAAAWEASTPSKNRPEDTSFRTSEPSDQAIRRWFGDPHLRAGESRTSSAVPLPRCDTPNAQWVFKVLATDLSGHRVSAWTTVSGTHN
jgi:hypothetical protein